MALGVSRLVRSVACALASFTALGAAAAADLPTRKDQAAIPAAPPAIDYFQTFFVKVGFVYGLNTSFAQLWAQNPAAMAAGNFASFPSGVGTSIGNLSTVGVEAGVFVTRNVSIDVSAGFPRYVDVKTKGFNWRNPALTNGTLLAEVMPALIPVTAVYHFDNFGAFRPYVGAGVAAAFAISTRNAFTTRSHVGGSIAPVLQAGFDYMVTPNWGLTADVKKTFAYIESRGDGMDVPGYGHFQAASYQHTHFQPWAFSVGLIYAFGGNGRIFPAY